jgi:hypothetical protein
VPRVGIIEMFSRQRPVTPREGGPALPTEDHLLRIGPPALPELVRKCMAVDPTRPTSKDMVEAMWDGRILYDVPTQAPAAGRFDGFLRLFLPYRRIAAGLFKVVIASEPPAAPGQASAKPTAVGQPAAAARTTSWTPF